MMKVLVWKLLNFSFSVAFLSTVCCGQELRFLVLGDWGGLPSSPYKTSVESAVAAQMGTAAQRFGTQFVVGLGDNFYYDGVKDIHDRRFTETFENIFKSKYLQSKWYMTAGNHDHRGNISAQVAYTHVSNRWYYPDYFYSVDFKVPGTNTTLHLIMIDTVILCGNTDHDFSREPPAGPENKHLAEKQWDWIENQLKNTKANYVIVAGHYPVYSIAEHGPTKCLEDRLMPMLYKYKVTAYMSGHDHNLQHLQRTMNGHSLNYFVVGCANFIDSSNIHKHSNPSGVSKFFWADKSKLGGFGYVQVSKYNMTFNFLESLAGSHGNFLYKPIVMKPRI